MSENTASNRLIRSSLKQAIGFYQHFLTRAGGFEALGRVLTNQIEQALVFRQLDNVQDAIQILCSLPLKHYQSVGQYYRALSIARHGFGQIDEASQLLYGVADCSPISAMATLALGSIAGIRGDHESELYFYQESLKTAHNLTTRIGAYRGIALLKSTEGDRARALKDLEQLLPVTRFTPPHIHFDYLNSLAVELGAVGRKDEARNVINHVLASPYASAYPEWLQTAGDLKPSDRSFVAIKTSPVNAANLLSMPADRHAEPTKQARPARVINLQQWKAKMGKDDTPNNRPPNEELDGRELMLRIYQLVSKRDRTGAELYDILNAIEKILAEHKAKQ